MGVNLFDDIQETAYSIVTNTMGYTATWTPSAGGEQQTAQVLLNKPTKTEKISDEEYDALRPTVEYKDDDLIGLFESVQKIGTETLVINGISFTPFRGEKKYDGKTIILTLEPNP